MEGEGSPGTWFFARNSGRKRREKEPSGSLATSWERPLKAWTSLQRLPEARATRKAVFQVRCFNEQERRGSKGACLREESTKNKSQAGDRRGDRASRIAAARNTSLRRGSSLKDGLPSWRIVVQTAALATRREEAERPLLSDKWPRKLASWMAEGLPGWTDWLEHQRSHLLQCAE